MALSRILAVAVAAMLGGLVFAAAPARACDSNYPWLCKPVPSIDPPPETAEPAKPVKPLQIANRRAAKAAKATAATAARKVAARKAAMRRFAARARMKTAAVNKPAEATVARADVAESRANAVVVPFPNPRPAVAPPRRVADGSGDSSTGFASMWAERSMAAMEAPRPEAPVATPQQADIAPANSVAAASVPVAPQSEVNEIDLAASDPLPPASDSSWVRSLFLAFGGLLAAGTALRFFI